jgi:ribosomal protein L12E/L44/L45/RPP1/RPP2
MSGGVAQTVESLLCKLGALSSNPSPTRKKKKQNERDRDTHRKMEEEERKEGWEEDRDSLCCVELMQL